MTIPELYELFIHNPKVTTEQPKLPSRFDFLCLERG